MKERYRAGFTLIEMLVVLAIIAVLVAILMPVFSRAREKARQARCKANLGQIAAAIRQYKTDYYRYPFRPYYDENLGIYIGGISSLYPDYVSDKANLTCPDDARNIRGMNLPDNYSTYNGVLHGFFDSTASGAAALHFEAQAGGAGSAGVPCLITYNYGGPDNDGWDMSYWDSNLGRWASTPDFNDPVPQWMIDMGKKRRHWPRLHNRRAPDNTLITHCRAHRFIYGRDETTSSPEPAEWRDMIVRLGGDLDTVIYQTWTAPKVAGASQWVIQE